MKRLLEILLKNNKFPTSCLFIGRKNWKLDEYVNFVIKFLISNNSDFMEIKPENEKNIKISQIREIIDFLSYTPFGKNKVVYIRSADLMTNEASNSLLKILEEPGENNYIILSAVSKYKLLPTILSRCVIFHLKPEGLDYIRANLDFDFDEKAFEKLKIENLKNFSFYDIHEILQYYAKEYDIEKMIKILIFSNLNNFAFVDFLLDCLSDLKSNISKDGIIGKLGFEIKFSGE